MKEIRTIIHIIAHAILSGLFLITGILRLFMTKIVNKSDSFLLLICCNCKRKSYYYILYIYFFALLMWSVPIRNWKVPDELQVPTLIWILWLFFTRITWINLLFNILAYWWIVLLILIGIRLLITKNKK